jgi:hypothetical protein
MRARAYTNTQIPLYIYLFIEIDVTTLQALQRKGFGCNALRFNSFQSFFSLHVILGSFRSVAMPYKILEPSEVESLVTHTPGAVYPPGCYPGYQQGARKYPKPDWPMTELDVGQGFEIPISDDRDVYGRSVKYIKGIIWQGNDLQSWGAGRRFKAIRQSNALLVKRLT